MSGGLAKLRDDLAFNRQQKGQEQLTQRNKVDVPAPWTVQTAAESGYPAGWAAERSPSESQVKKPMIP